MSEPEPFFSIASLIATPTRARPLEKSYLKWVDSYYPADVAALFHEYHKEGLIEEGLLREAARHDLTIQAERIVAEAADVRAKMEALDAEIAAAEAAEAADVDPSSN